MQYLVNELDLFTDFDHCVLKQLNILALTHVVMSGPISPKHVKFPDFEFAISIFASFLLYSSFQLQVLLQHQLQRLAIHQVK